MSVVAPTMIRWHVSKTETLPFHFGFHEKKPVSYENFTTHRNSLKRLDQHFFLLRQQGDALIVNQQAIADTTPPTPVHTIDHKKQAEHKYDKEDKLRDELTVGGGLGAVADEGMYEKSLIEQTATAPQHETMVASNKTLGAENATYDRIDEPTTVAAIDQHILSPHAASATADLPPKDDILNLPAKDEVLDLSKAELVVNESGVPVVIPVAEPMEPTVIEAVKEVQHPEAADEEEREEAERAAAQAALASGSLGAIEHQLLTNAAKTMQPIEQDTTTVHMPVAEPVGTYTTTLHAPHPSLDGSQSIAETLSTESGAATSDAASLEELREQHEAEAAAAKAETDRLESESMSAEERETAEMELMSRTKRLAALHERIIRQQTLEAAGPDVTSIKLSPGLAPTTASSRIMEIQQLHLAQQAESGVTHTVVEKQAPVPRGSRTKELARMHEAKIKEEGDAKKQQDDVFSGKAKVETGKGGKGKKGNNKKR